MAAAHNPTALDTVMAAAHNPTALDTVMAAAHNPTALDTALDGGRTLIEASAGSGKTRAITTLVARQLVEQDLPIQDILVVTFTKAATAELRERVRLLLRQIQDVLTDSASGTDQQQARELLRQWELNDSLGEHQIRDRVTDALLDIDRANIVTIHGFCQRALGEFAFETGLPFDFEVSGEGAGIVESVVRDLWQHRFGDSSIEFAEHLINQPKGKFLPDQLSRWLGGNRAKCFADIHGVPSAALLTPEKTRQDFDREVYAVRDLWKDHIGEYLVFMLTAVKGNSYQLLPPALPDLPLVSFPYTHVWRTESGKYFPVRRPDHIETELLWMKGILHSEDPISSLKHLQRLSRKYSGREVKKHLKRGYQLADNPLFAALDRLSDNCNREVPDRFNNWLKHFQEQLLQEGAREIRRIIHRERRLGYDDLILELNRELQGEAGQRLAASLRRRFPVALIDEFQDTDPVQEQIFASIYDPAENRASAPAKASGLYLVGDPKQSIYEFRGADIFAYLSAQRDSQSVLQLTHNWRSAPRLVAAVNTLFSVPMAFTVPEIHFTPTTPGRDEASLTIEGEDPQPLTLWLAEDQENNGDAEKVVAHETANDIARLLRLSRDGKARLGSQSLKASDIAVLVHTNNQGKNIAAALQERGCKSVQIGETSVFETREAEQLRRLLLAVANPQRKDYRCAALTADFFGLGNEELLALREDDRYWTHWNRQFIQWHDRWQASGIGATLRAIMAADGNTANLLRCSDGPRRLTNLNHLAELLHEAEAAHRFSPTGLQAWFNRCIHGQQAGPEGQEDSPTLRLSSDEDLVRILTIHRSKGLEFPVVYLPFAWHSKQIYANNPDPVSYHERDGQQFRTLLDLSPGDDSKNRRQLEEFGEAVRLLYVALTRARERCTVAWTRVTSNRSKLLPPLAWLLHRTRQQDEALDRCKASVPAASGSVVPDEVVQVHDEIKGIIRNTEKMPRQVFEAQVNTVVGRCPSGIRIQEIHGKKASTGQPPKESRAPLSCRQFSRPLRRTRQMTSFSSLTAEPTPAATRLTEPGAPDYDEAEISLANQPVQPEAMAQTATATGETPPQQDAYHFPRGIHVGSCLHRIFEILDAEPERPVAEVCAEQLGRSGIDTKWQDTACRMVENTRHTELQEPGQSAFRLADIDHRLTELEFYFPVNNVNQTALGQLLARHGYPNLLPGGPDDQQDARTIDGYLRGFIDLTLAHRGRWYVLDYKSNWLGNSPEDYERKRLVATMEEHRYPLQYLIYLLALHRYLGTRLPDYEYEQHMGGAFYLFLRGMTPGTGMARGVWFDRPSRQCMEALDRFMGGEET